MRTMLEMQLLELFPDTAAVEGSELVLGGARATDLVREFGTPVVVYDEQTLRNQARAYAAAASMYDILSSMQDHAAGSQVRGA